MRPIFGSPNFHELNDADLDAVNGGLVNEAVSGAIAGAQKGTSRVDQGVLLPGTPWLPCPIPLLPGRAVSTRIREPGRQANRPGFSFSYLAFALAAGQPAIQALIARPVPLTCLPPPATLLSRLHFSMQAGSFCALAGVGHH